MRFLSVLLGLMLATGTAVASPFDVSDLRTAIAARDFDAVDAGLDAAQAEFLAGKRTAEDMRTLYIALSRSDAKTVRFGEDWLARDQDNPKAQISRAWTLFNASNAVMRGQNDFAYEVAQSMRRQSNELAFAAYEQQPDLIPAADALTRGLGQVLPTSPHPLDALDKIMTAHPNFGSVQRSLQSGQLNERSGVLLQKFCQSVSNSFDAPQRPVMLHRCLMEAGFLFDRTDLQAYVEEHLWSDDDPETAIVRLAYFLSKFKFHDATMEQMDWARDVLLNHPVDQYQLVFLTHYARSFEEKIRSRHGMVEMFMHQFKKDRLALAESFLEHDPLNIDLLNLVEGVEFDGDFEVISKADGNVSFRQIKVDRTPDEQRAFLAARFAQSADFSLRRLQASPYNAEYWSAYSFAASSKNLPESHFDGDAAMQNAVVFSNDPAQMLLDYMDLKHRQFRSIEQAAALSEEELAQVPDWKRFLTQTNVPKQILCPFLRAEILQGEICKYYPAGYPQCRPSAGQTDEVRNRLAEMSRNSPECAGLLSALPEDLWYDAVDFDAATARVVPTSD